MYPRNINNPNGFPIDHVALKNAISFVKRNLIVFGMHLSEEATLRGNIYINAQSLLIQLRNLVIRWKKGDRNGVGTKFVELSRQLGLVISRKGALSAPVNLEFDNLTHEAVDLTWELPEGNVGFTGITYVLERSEDEDFAATETVYTGATAAFGDDGLDPETTYYYRVKSKKADYNDSPWSATLEVTTVEAP